MSDPTKFEDAAGTPAAPIHDTTDTSAGKHLELMVPDFKSTAASGGTPMNSYLRLGDAHTQAANPARKDRGEDLAAKVLGFTDDTRNRGDATSQAPHAPHASPGLDPPPDIGDFRLRESGAPTSLDGQQPWLHKKGGWRDHSDGNRISTTRGDKVEVIRGNYKLVVLGRTDDMDNAVGWDMSGGQLDTDSADLGYPGASATRTSADQTGLDVKWEWTRDADDSRYRWHVTTRNGTPGDPESLDSYTYTWAHIVESYVGSADPLVHNGPVQRAFSVKNGTWTKEETDVLDVSDKLTTTTNAGTMIETVAVAGLHTVTSSAAEQLETLTVSGTHTVTTSAKSETDTLNITEDLTTHTNAGSFTETTTVTSHMVTETTGTMVNLYGCGASFNLNGTALSLEFDIGALWASVNFVLLLAELKALMHIDMHGIVHLDWHNGTHADLHNGLHVSFDNAAFPAQTVQTEGEMVVAAFKSFL